MFLANYTMQGSLSHDVCTVHASTQIKGVVNGVARAEAAAAKAKQQQST